MRHKYKGRKLGTSYAHTKAMKRSLVQALFLNDRIKTIESRAKEIRPDVDKIITWAKRGNLHSRRLAIAALGNDSELVGEIFEKVAQGMFADRQGGYTRITKLGPRKGDNAPMVIMELITEALPQRAENKATGAKAKAKKVESAKDQTSPEAEKSETEEATEESTASATEQTASPADPEDSVTELVEVPESDKPVEIATELPSTEEEKPAKDESANKGETEESSEEK